METTLNPTINPVIEPIVREFKAALQTLYGDIKTLVSGKDGILAKETR